ncbi:MAG: 4-hydroxythreonine-4-phosphate dehydrogenase PdxA [Muribaculum sp.]|nr:4-hydroxythreonine-4-phosphate dehydrogenase PdxA [Muribaculum sp.]
MSKLLRVGITQGDINGVGYEVIFKALADAEILELITPVVFGSSGIAAETIKNLSLQGIHFTPVESVKDVADGRINVVDVCVGKLIPTPGIPSEAGGVAALKALEASVEALNEGEIDVLVTAPIDKNTIHSEEFQFPGHTEYLASKFSADDERPLMILFADRLRVALVTTHLPISEVAQHITEENVEASIRDFDAALRRDFLCERPLIAVLGLNPHCGDGGLIGDEEQTAIIPAIEAVKKDGILAFGPFPADGFFAAGNYNKFDGVLAMYHDQGLAPFKAIAGQRGVNFTAGLEIVRTSPDHGTAYDLAGKNIADPSSMREAIYRAVDIYRARAMYEEAIEDPLPVETPSTSKNDKSER